MAINISDKPRFALSVILASPIIILTLVYVPIAYALHLAINLFTAFKKSDIIP